MNQGLVIAQLIEKQKLSTKESHPYYLLKLNLHQNLTQTYFKLTGQKRLTLKTTKPFYLFPKSNK
jgi:hypothetical protein